MKHIQTFENFINEGDMTKFYDGFVVLDYKTKKLYKFKYVRGTSNSKVEDAAISDLAKEIKQPSSNFAVHGFVKKGEWNTSTAEVLESVYEAAENFAAGDLVRYSKPGSGLATLYGVVTKSYAMKVDLAIVGKSNDKEMQPTETYMKGQFKPTWEGGGMKADELEKKSGGAMPELQKRYLTRWDNS